MLKFKDIGKKKTVNLISCAVAVVVVLVSAIAMIASSRYMRLTIGADFVIRWLLIFVVGASIVYGLVRMGLCSLTGGDPSRAISQAFMFFGLAELCAIVISVLTLIGDADYQQNVNLIEDLLCAVFHLILGVLALFGHTFKSSRKKAFIVSVIAAAIALFLMFLEVAFIGHSTVRAQKTDFVYVMSSVGAIFPYVAAAIFSRTMLGEENAEEKADVEAEQ